MENCVEDVVTLKTDDVRQLYDAFISLCDYIEENVYCGNCPLYETLCGNKDKTNVDLFSKALKNIRDKCGIKIPGD